MQKYCSVSEHYIRTFEQINIILYFVILTQIIFINGQNTCKTKIKITKETHDLYIKICKTIFFYYYK